MATTMSYTTDWMNESLFWPVEVNASNLTADATQKTSYDQAIESKLIIPLYCLIFVLAVLGNTFVLVTLLRNKKMRTVTNVYLLNLAISDLLLGVFCMPFTLVGQVLRNFVFGQTMCRLIPYFQAVSVSVGVWTLVAISLERYFAICRPLKSRRWQTQFHAYKMIAFVWLASLCWSGPVLVVSSLQAMKKGHKCREVWPSRRSEQIFNLFLDVMLLMVPMLIMSLAYMLIMNKLWKGLQREIQHNTRCQQQILQGSQQFCDTVDEDGQYYGTSNPERSPLRTNVSSTACNAKIMKTTFTQNRSSTKRRTVKMWLMKGFKQVKLSHPTPSFEYNHCEKKAIISKLKPSKVLPSKNNNFDGSENVEQTTYTFSRHVIRSNHMDKSIEAKRKVIRMLFVIVAEFFICWAPLHILNTWYLFYPEEVYKYVGSTGISLIQLLAYVSSCCNPITYCFMNRKFRQAFLTVFNCSSCSCFSPQESHSSKEKSQTALVVRTVHNASDASGNDSTVYVGRASTPARSVVVLEAEDRV